MGTTHGNPNHPVSLAMEQQWHKIAALIMQAAGLTDVEITAELIRSLHGKSVVADARGGRLLIRVVDEAEADRLTREHGGRPF